MFLGREEELKKIGAELKKSSAFIIVYGTRRVGKTALIMEALKKSPDKTIYYECSTGSFAYNAAKFTDKIEDAGVTFPDRDKTVIDDLNCSICAETNCPGHFYECDF